MTVSGIDWEDAFLNGAYIPDGDRYPEHWRQSAETFRSSAKCQLDISYADHERAVLDVFHPSGTSRGLAVIVHGGYWLQLDKSSWSDLAEGALGHQWTVAVPSYPLAPEASVAEITRHVGLAISHVARSVNGPIRLVGHSAGGHLVSRMMCDNAPVPPEISSRIERIISISGLHDLRPLRIHSMNDQLGISEEIALTESPALRDPIQGPEFVAWVGELERPEFLRQSSLIVEAWRRKNAAARLVVEAQRHHFNVIDGLKDYQHPLAMAFAD